MFNREIRYIKSLILLIISFYLSSNLHAEEMSSTAAPIETEEIESKLEINNENENSPNSNPEKEIKEEDKSFHSFYLDGEFRYFSISGTDPLYNVSQKLTFKAASLEEVGLIQNWHRDFKSYLGVNYSILQVSNSNAGIAINNTVNREINFVAGAKYHLLSFLYLQAEYNYGGILVFRALNVQSVKIESILISKLNMGSGVTFLNYSSFGLHAEGAYAIIIPNNDSNYGNIGGNGFETALLLTYQGKDWGIKSKFYYNLLNLNTRPINLKYQEYGVRLGFYIDL
ncbi:hypothetical protein [Silvanigrella sp.]|uniref:hypothetical protein n=1 Tax=Silvanigrella sp. TaxID=2024976 RepID=UPI0037CC0F79